MSNRDYRWTTNVSMTTSGRVYSLMVAGPRSQTSSGDVWRAHDTSASTTPSYTLEYALNPEQGLNRSISNWADHTESLVACSTCGV